MKKTFEVKLSPEFLARLEKDVQDSVVATGSASAFEGYNKGGGPAGDYDRQYDRHTGKTAGLASKEKEGQR